MHYITIRPYYISTRTTSHRNLPAVVSVTPPPPSFHPIPLSVAAWFAGSVRSAIDFACGSQCRQASALDVLLVALLPCGYVTTHHGDPPVAFAEQPDRSAFIETAYVFSEDAALPLAHWKS